MIYKDFFFCHVYPGCVKGSFFQYSKFLENQNINLKFRHVRIDSSDRNFPMDVIHGVKLVKIYLNCQLYSPAVKGGLARIKPVDYSKDNL